MNITIIIYSVLILPCCNRMFISLFLIQVVLSFLFTLAFCGNKSTSMSPFGEPMGSLGPTIVEKPNNVDDDVNAFNKHIGEIDLKPIAQLIANRTLTQRLAIADAYQKKYTNVILDINTIRFGPAEDLYSGFFIALPEYLARRIQFSLDMKAHWTYMSIICTSSATRLKAINDAYFKVYGKDLKDELDNQLRDPEGKLVLKRIIDPNFMRPDSGSNPDSVNAQLDLIPTKKVPCHNSDNLLDLMTSQSFEQLKLVAETYAIENDGVSVVDMFRYHCRKGDLQEAYKRIIRYAADPYEYYAEEYYLGMDNNDLNTRADRYIITTRNEVDLKDVLNAYKIKYRKDPVDLVTKWQDDDYKNLFLAVLKGNN